MPKTYNIVMVVLVMSGVFCAVLADTALILAVGLALVVVGAAGLSSGYVTYLDDDIK